MNAATRTLRARLRHRTRAWARRRQGTDAASVTLESRRIYILPTRSGLLFAVTLFTMLLGAINYNNNMGFAFTFLLSGIAIISIHHCHRNLRGLVVTSLGAEPVFAGETTQFRFAIENHQRHLRAQIALRWSDADATWADLAANMRQTINLGRTADARGYLPMPSLQVSTTYPLGLFRAWAWVNMEHAALVYPRPAAQAPAPAQSDAGRHRTARTAQGDEDFAGLRSFRAGDPIRHIAWKAFARTGEKLIVEHDGGDARPLMLDGSMLPGRKPEQRLSILARQVLDAHAAGVEYGLRLPGASIAPGHGDRHRHRCLKALATFGLTP